MEFSSRALSKADVLLSKYLSSYCLSTSVIPSSSSLSPLSTPIVTIGCCRPLDGAAEVFSNHSRRDWFWWRCCSRAAAAVFAVVASCFDKRNLRWVFPLEYCHRLVLCHQSTRCRRRRCHIVSILDAHCLLRHHRTHM